MERKIRLMIIDDSAVYRNWLITQLSKDEHLEIIGYATDAFDARKKIPALKPDVLTLDIEMPGISGMEIPQQLKGFLPNVRIIFVTSHTEYAIDAFELSIFRYVPKNNLEVKLAAFKTLNTMRRFCRYAQATSEATEFNLYSETDHLYIWIRMITRFRDYNVYVHYYDKAAVGGK